MFLNSKCNKHVMFIWILCQYNFKHDEDLATWRSHDVRQYRSEIDFRDTCRTLAEHGGLLGVALDAAGSAITGLDSLSVSRLLAPPRPCREPVLSFAIRSPGSRVTMS